MKETVIRFWDKKMSATISKDFPSRTRAKKFRKTLSAKRFKSMDTEGWVPQIKEK